jgi:hypothetical protein
MGAAAALGAVTGGIGGGAGAVASKAAPYVGSWIGKAVSGAKNAPSAAANSAPRLLEASRQAAAQTAQVTQSLGNRAMANAAGQGTISSGASLVQTTAQKVADAGLPALKASMSGPQVRALASRPYLERVYAGTQVHERTAQVLRVQFPGRFEYNRVGPEFLDTWTGEQIELTTSGSVAEHMRRSGYGAATHVTYRIP